MMQQGKGADMGAAFGSGAAGTVFGAGGGGSFLTRATAILAMVFFVNCLLIASPLVRNVGDSSDSIAEAIEQQEAAQADITEAVEAVVEKAVKGMLPKSRLGSVMFRNLYVVAGETHEHEAQQPKKLDLNTIK